MLTGELANSDTDQQAAARRTRRTVHEGAAVQAHVRGAYTDAGFYNPNSLQSAGQSQAGAKLAYSLNAGNCIVAEAHGQQLSTVRRRPERN